VSLDPAMATPLPAVQGGPGQVTTTVAAAWPPPVTRVEVLPLKPGDRVIIHVDGAAGMSSGGAAKAGQDVLAALKLADLPFEVPVIVVAPGIRVEVARPS
jgi:hypothetical protein